MNDRQLRVRRGVVIAWDGKTWTQLLKFDSQIKNQRGYLGVDFIDPQYHYGFILKTDRIRSDLTQGFTIYFTVLDAELRPQGMPIQVSWNTKTKSFQEYAPNELDPADFKPEVLNPPIRRSR